MNYADYDFTVNLLNTKGTNAALVEYSVQFLKAKRTVLTTLPRPKTTIAIELGGAGEAVGVPGNDVTGISMYHQLEKDAAQKVLAEADSVEFTARLSTGSPIKLELARLAQGPKGAQKGEAT